ncbi:hypothetical protein QBC33DRAFT_174907 [Phialemonium atrogriseum]|uniref:Uncharacterized protein n=1 Tax=Phialemonium atrogriseum TaxID=1093897 RepID=A0AAJ0BVF0_9PEZI|nr:uncharacterized protein QBC33DRAFT_174907 [Phialemonium atrogriseum]KAK1765203.1 hypothetical protein QBC33DRAFT_174907 [Phialemonium atrogriseum]
MMSLVAASCTLLLLTSGWYTQRSFCNHTFGPVPRTLGAWSVWTLRPRVRRNRRRSIPSLVTNTWQHTEENGVPKCFRVGEEVRVGENIVLTNGAAIRPLHACYLHILLLRLHCGNGEGPFSPANQSVTLLSAKDRA